MKRSDRLDDVIGRRDRLRESVSRITGRLEAARAELAKVEQEIRSKGIDPKDLDAAIETLDKHFDRAVADLETRVAAAEEALKPFVGEE